jgi:hypothetical protein
MVEEAGKPKRPRFVNLARAARDEWESYTAALAGRINAADFPPHLAGVAGKLKGYAARLALVSMLLRAGFEPGADVEDLSAADMRAGAALALYFLGHAERVYHAMGRDRRTILAAKVLDWIKARGKSTFKPTDVYQALRSRLLTRPEQVYTPLRLLAHLRHVREQATPYAGTGQRPDPTYYVHPYYLGNGTANTGNP